LLKTIGLVRSKDTNAYLVAVNNRQHRLCRQEPRKVEFMFVADATPTLRQRLADGD